MFGFFTKKNKKKAARGVKKEKENIKAEDQQVKQQVTNELLNSLNTLQKQLDRLKLHVTGAVEHEIKENGKITKKALSELQQKECVIIKNENEKIIEGVFDGQNMIGADGQQYDVPANYASKSKLVEGDILKLTISNLGTFIYKQIKPIERQRKVGILEQDPQNLQFYAVAEGKKWKLLTASVTYFKGEPGDEVVFIIPAEAGSRWAAVENIMKP